MTLAEAIEAYIAEQKTLGLAPSTVNNQGGFVRRFGREAERLARSQGKRGPLRCRDLTSAHVTAFFASHKGKEGNRNQMLIALRKFLRWLELQRLIRSGEAARLLGSHKSLKVVREPKYYVPVEDFGTLLDSQVRHPSDRMAMALAIFTLSRRSEIQAIRLEHINLAEATLTLYRAKTRRWNETGITPELMDELTSYLQWYAKELGYDHALHLIETQPKWRLIPRLSPVRSRSADGRCYGPAVRHEMDPMSSPGHMERYTKTGLDATGAVTPSGSKTRHKGEGMHTIRRSGARAMLRHLSETLGQDRALLQVSVMLDHQDTQTTLAYIGMDQEREQLNDWLRSNSMYGTRPPAQRRLRAV